MMNEAKAGKVNCHYLRYVMQNEKYDDKNKPVSLLCEKITRHTGRLKNRGWRPYRERKRRRLELLEEGNPSLGGA